MGGPGRMMAQETSKPVQVSATLRRLAGYFRPHWPVLRFTMISHSFSPGTE